MNGKTNTRVVRLKRQPWHAIIEKIAADDDVDTDEGTRDGVETGITDQIESLVLLRRSIPADVEDYEQIAGAIEKQIVFLNRMLRTLAGGLDGIIDDRSSQESPATY